MVRKKSGRKYFVLDTSVLVHDPGVINQMGDNVVVIPIWVLEELDHLKGRQDHVGECARRASQIIDGYREKANKLGRSLSKGTATEAGGLLYTDFDGQGCAELPVPLEPTNDNKIIAVAWKWERKFPGKVILLSKDINLRTKADCLGIRAENYKYEQLVERLEGVHTGRIDIQVGLENAYLLTDLVRKQSLTVEAFEPFVKINTLLENQCCWIKTGENKFTLAIWRNGFFHAVPRWTARVPQSQTIDVKPCNPEQAAAYALLMNPEITFVTLSGQAGCGKTLMALYAGYNQMIEGVYDKIIVFRLTHEVGEKIGYLPGDHD